LRLTAASICFEVVISNNRKFSGFPAFKLLGYPSCYPALIMAWQRQITVALKNGFALWQLLATISTPPRDIQCNDSIFQKHSICHKVVQQGVCSEMANFEENSISCCALKMLENS
jgi:hypothetical protein